MYDFTFISVQNLSSCSVEDRKNRDHLKENHQFTFVASLKESETELKLAVVPEEEFMQAIEEDTNNDQSKDTVNLNIGCQCSIIIILINNYEYKIYIIPLIINSSVN